MPNPAHFRSNPAPSWLLPICSAGMFLAWVSVALHVRIALGHWPRPMWEDYHPPVFTAHLFLVMSITALAVAAFPAWGVLLLFRKFRLSPRAHALQAVFYSCGWLFLGLFVRVDPFRFFAWLAD